MGDIQPASVLTIDEQRELLGYSALNNEEVTDGNDN
jgi:hypothetical protein